MYDHQRKTNRGKKVAIQIYHHCLGVHVMLVVMGSNMKQFRGVCFALVGASPFLLHLLKGRKYQRIATSKNDTASSSFQIWALILRNTHILIPDI